MNDVDRLEKLALASWSTFGEDALAERDGRSSQCFAYVMATGDLLWLPEPSQRAFDHSIRVCDDTDASQQTSRLALRCVAVEALCRNLGRVLRWGGGSTCSVLAHSIRVAHLAAAIERALHPDSPGRALIARRAGALHDLAEGLPGIGDIPSPALRWMRAAMPEYDRVHARAFEVVARLTDIELHWFSLSAVKVADRLAMAIERAVYFEDTPAWLGPDLCRVAAALPAVQGMQFFDSLADDCRREDTFREGQYAQLHALSGPDEVPAVGWSRWCDRVLLLLGAQDPSRTWRDVLRDMYEGVA